MKKVAFLACLLMCVAAAPRVLAHADIAGEWDVEFSAASIHNEDDTHMYVNQDDSRLTGYVEWNSSPDTYPLKGNITDDHFRIAWTSSVNGVMSDIVFEGAVKGDELHGAVEITGRQPGTFFARRIAR
jgi:hypothetical protein